MESVHNPILEKIRSSNNILGLFFHQVIGETPFILKSIAMEYSGVRFIRANNKLNNLSVFYPSPLTGQQSGQSVIRSITYLVHEIETMLNRSYKIQIQWCSGHSKVEGNEIAHHHASPSTEVRRVIQGDKTTPPSSRSSVPWISAIPPLSLRTIAKP